MTDEEIAKEYIYKHTIYTIYTIGHLNSVYYQSGDIELSFSNKNEDE